MSHFDANNVSFMKTVEVLVFFSKRNLILSTMKISSLEMSSIKLLLESYTDVADPI